MSALVPFTLTRAQERQSSEITFRPSKHGVILCCGTVETLLTQAQINDHAALYQREEAAAQALVDNCHRLFNALIDAECRAQDAFGWRSQ